MTNISPETHKWAKHKWELLPDGESVVVWIKRKKDGKVIPFLFDLDFLETYTKSMNARYYRGWRAQNGKTYVHQLVVNLPLGCVTDHIDGDTQDNRRRNLRVCSNKENSRNQKKYITNTSGYKGAVKYKNKYKAQIMVNRKTLHLGCFNTIEEAACAYDAAAVKYFGEFASLNFPEEHRRDVV